MLFLVFRKVYEIFKQECIHTGKLKFRKYTKLCILVENVNSICTVKPVHVFTFIEVSPVLKGHLFLVFEL